MSDVEADSAIRTVVDPDRLAAAMARAVAPVDRSRAARGLPPGQILVQTPGFEFVSGDRARPFHAASAGKSMTATLAFALAEERRLDLDAPITRVLPAADWRGLFVRGGRDGAAEVTTRRLLTHTSGTADYFGGRTTGGPSFARLLQREPDRLWTPADLLAFSRDHQRAIAAPGARFAYSDTGYVLLARVVEETGGATLGAQLHERIFAPAGMADSCLLFHTVPGGRASSAADPAGELGIGPLVLGRQELSRARALSCDWGGGGIVTTLDDLSRFWTSWGAGAFVGDASRSAMGAAQHRFRPGIRYGAGLMQVRYDGFSPFLRGLPRPVGHLGVTSVHSFTVPELGLRLVMNLHSTREMVRSFRLHVRLVQLLARALRG
ncbi:serine hydrolase domain-containing protein [Microbacterium sp. CPCC 204701]|uniref:serine hydrolase domain-containing protein n=1 Tax=Microbacterium sp. CPCC 204701 TaxID=2493084 RepID=UPI000FDB1849|nr:serine hydrolase domain-containing protein [Microbacterium sp. CPCC 204701]